LSEPLKVEVTPVAALQIEAAANWWVKNRPAAPDAIRVDFQEAVSLLSRQPGVGAKSSTARYPNLRRLYLARVRYHVYYQVESGTVFIVAFWHASRGSKPDLVT
jgi:plasmid stabilization system protein ParE